MNDAHNIKADDVTALMRSRGRAVMADTKFENKILCQLITFCLSDLKEQKERKSKTEDPVTVKSRSIAVDSYS